MHFIYFILAPGFPARCCPYLLAMLIAHIDASTSASSARIHKAGRVLA